MASTGKFQFDRSFDRPELGGGALPEIETPRFSLTEEEISAMRASAHAEGFAEARKMFGEDVEARRNILLAEIAAGIAKLPELFAAEEKKRCMDAARVALGISAKFLPPLIARMAGEVMDTAILSALADGREEPRLVIRVGTAMLDGLKDRIDRLAAEAGFAGQIVLLSDPDFSGADCRIEWAEGGIERSARKTWQSIEQIIASYGDNAAAPEQKPQ